MTRDYIYEVDQRRRNCSAGDLNCLRRFRDHNDAIQVLLFHGCSWVHVMEIGPVASRQINDANPASHRSFFDHSYQRSRVATDRTVRPARGAGPRVSEEIRTEGDR